MAADPEGTKGHAMPRQQPVREEHDDGFKEEPRDERLRQRTEGERAWLYERHPDLKRTIGLDQAAKAAARKEIVRTPR